MTAERLHAPRDPWGGGQVTSNVACVLAPNPSPLTLDGTNTWIVAPEGAVDAVVIDPGPDHAGHLASITAWTRDRGRHVRAVLLTHGHADHALGARGLSRALGCPVVAAATGLNDGAVIDVDGVELEIVATPGHSSDSISILVRQDAALLTGDTILGRGTAVIAYPDGDLAQYLASLQRIRALTVGPGPRARLLLPGHGAPTTAARATVDAYLAHRSERLDQVRAALEGIGGPEGLERAWSADVDAERIELAQRIVEVVYAEIPQSLWPAARASVLAQLAYIRVG